jgi:ammonium transporter, Amt family
MTWIILWVVDHTVGLRVSADEEETGLDLAEHGEDAYVITPTEEPTGSIA